MEFEGKVVIITGGAQGIGRSIALAFAKEGANICILDVKPDGMRSTLDEIRQLGRDGAVYTADVSSESQVKEGIRLFIDKFGRIDILVNNAGLLERALVEESTQKHWDRMLGINLLGAVFCSQAAIPVMKKQGGSIINCSSILGSFPNTGSAAYGVAKLGVVLLTRVMSAELAPFGIRVNCYSPGVANTEFAAEVISKRGAEKLEQIALRQFGPPEEIANLVVFLASSKASYITGQTIAVDGGMWVTQTPTKTWKEEDGKIK